MIEEKIKLTVNEAIADEGFYVVNTKITTTGTGTDESQRKTVQVFCEGVTKNSNGEVSSYFSPTLDDCIKLTRIISAVFDVEDFIAGKYDLQVSGAGLDRELITSSDFSRFHGFLVKVKLNSPHNIFDEKNVRKFNARIAGINDEKGEVCFIKYTESQKNTGKEVKFVAHEKILQNLEELKNNDKFCANIPLNVIDSCKILITDRYLKDKNFN